MRKVSQQSLDKDIILQLKAAYDQKHKELQELVTSIPIDLEVISRLESEYWAKYPER